MAKLIEETITIKVSKLVKDGADSEQLISASILENIEVVVQELCGGDLIVELGTLA